MDQNDIRPWETPTMAAQRQRCELAGAVVTYRLLLWIRALQLEGKFNASQPRNPAGMGRESGRWSGDPGAGEATLVPVGLDRPDSFSVDLQEDEGDISHTIKDHVGKSEVSLVNRILDSRITVLGYRAGLWRAGSFPSLVAANKLVSSTLSQNSSAVNDYLSGRGLNAFKPWLTVVGVFSSPTGVEAYVENLRMRPSIRATHLVKVIIRAAPERAKGFYVLTAFPTEEN